MLRAGLTAGLYSSIKNDNVPAAIGFSVLKDLQNNYETKKQCGAARQFNQEESKNKNQEVKYYKRVKHTRTYIIPEDCSRCTAITQQGERCQCRKLQESDYCVTHNKKLNPSPIIVQEEKIKNPIRRTWKNLYGLLN